MKLATYYACPQVVVTPSVPPDKPHCCGNNACIIADATCCTKETGDWCDSLHYCFPNNNGDLYNMILYPGYYCMYNGVYM